jgi:UDP-N-acetylmuramoyl-tripeptide--D-alanyl-D-alanine ligase
MKEIFKKIVVKILKVEAGLILKKHQPFIVAITGNLGKTTTKDYVAHVYRKQFGDENVRATEKSLNSEFGVPLTILGQKSAWDNSFLWLKIIFKTFFQEYFRKDFPKYFILEVGADHKGDIKDISEYVKPDICILTAMQKNLVHGEYFKNRDEHVKEKNI